MTEELYLDANGIRFRVLAAGPSGGDPVLLLHGFPEGAESWGPQLDSLSAAGYRVLAPDLRGYGGTEAPEGEANYTAELLVADVAALVAAVGGSPQRPVHLAGHDWGSVIGWAAVSLRPELFATWTALSVPHPYEWQKAALTDPDQQTRSAYIQLFVQVGKAEEVLSTNDHRALRAIYQGVMPGPIVERYVESMARPGRLTAGLNYYRANLKPGAGFDAYRRPVRVPTMLIWGSADPALGRVAVDATAAHVEAPYRLEVLEGAGHWLQFERASEVCALLGEQVRSRV